MPVTRDKPHVTSIATLRIKSGVGRRPGILPAVLAMHPAHGCALRLRRWLPSASQSARVRSAFRAVLQPLIQDNWPVLDETRGPYDPSPKRSTIHDALVAP